MVTARETGTASARHSRPYAPAGRPHHVSRDFVLACRQRAVYDGGMTESARPLRLMAQFRRAIRLRHFSPRTEEAYAGWIRRFVRFHGLRHPIELGAAEVEAFLGHLTEQRELAASSQAQARSALLFLYRVVLRCEARVADIPRAKSIGRVPVVLTRDEVRRLLARMAGTPRLVALLLYGSGLRLLEALELRVKDIDFESGELRIRRAKGGKDRITMLSRSLVPALGDHLERRRRVHQGDLARGEGLAPLPGAFGRKSPGSAREWGWQYVFPAGRRHLPRGGSGPMRHHLHESVVAGGTGGGARGGNDQAGLLPHPAPLVRHPPAAGRVRHPHGAGAVGAPRRGDDDDLYACAQPGRVRGSEPGGSAVTGQGGAFRAPTVGATGSRGEGVANAADFDVFAPSRVGWWFVASTCYQPRECGGECAGASAAYSGREDG